MDINNSGKLVFDHIKILFLGIVFDRVEVYQFKKNNTVKKTIHQELTPENTDLKRDKGPKRIVGVEIDDANSFKKRFVELLKEVPMASVAAFYFVVEKRKQLPLIMHVIKERSLGESKLYGIDPDYFFSLVPLTGKGYKNIEHHILGLKANYSVKVKVKLMIKKLLVYLLLSRRLYEAFVVTVQPAPIPPDIQSTSNSVVLSRDVQLLENFLLTNWKEFIGTPLPEVIQAVPITSCTHEYGNDLILIFTDRCLYPAYVMKISRNPSYNFKLKREFSSLHSLHGIDKFKSFIPTPYYMGSLAQKTFFIQKGLPGLSLSKLIGHYGLNITNQQLLNEAVDILVAINTAPIDSHGKDPGNYDTSRDTFELFEKEYIASGISKKKLEALKEYHKNWAAKELSFFLHGDYWLVNLLVNKQSTRIAGIIDWEFSELNSPLPTDIILFIINIGYILGLRLDFSKSPLDLYKWTFFTEGDHVEFLKSYYQRYMKGIGIDGHSFVMLLELTLAKMAMREIQAYGKHGEMDRFYLEALKYTTENQRNVSEKF